MGEQDLVVLHELGTVGEVGWKDKWETKVQEKSHRVRVFGQEEEMK